VLVPETNGKIFRADPADWYLGRNPPFAHAHEASPLFGRFGNIAPLLISARHNGSIMKETAQI
jgi:hypothetical protein